MEKTIIFKICLVELLFVNHHHFHLIILFYLLNSIEELFIIHFYKFIWIKFQFHLHRIIFIITNFYFTFIYQFF